MRRWEGVLAPIVIGMWLGASCSSSSTTREDGHRADAGDGGAAGAGAGRGGRAGTSAGGSSGDAGAGNEAGTDNEAGAGGAAPSCGDVGAVRCAGNVRERCEASGSWERLPRSEQCAGSTPVCNAGVCAAFKLVDGTIDALGAYPNPKSGATYVLTRQSLLGLSRACGSSYCVTGSIRP